MPITLGDCTWKTTLSGQPEVQSLPCSQLGLDVLEEGADWRWGPGLGSRRACPTPALALPCEVALGAPLTPFVSASLLSLCLGGLQCVKHRAELRRPGFQLQSNSCYVSRPLKCFVLLGKMSPFFSAVWFASLSPAGLHDLSYFPSPALLHTQERESGHWSHNPGSLFWKPPTPNIFRCLPGLSFCSRTTIPACHSGFTWETAWLCCQTQLFFPSSFL